ncbi:MAG: YccF domain-containing protein [Plesiomonas sp.]|uniref:YccF domain-containing protein n=1 Tax=Plesiomonas sp. TaxID=2486279 RepID=UPI003F2F4819
MATILNIFNFVMGGFITTLGWLLATLLSIVCIITLPLTRSCWEITKMSLVPYGNDVVKVDDLENRSNSILSAGGFILNIIWFVVAGWWLCIVHIMVGITQCITIIGIPVGIAHFKLAIVALWPVGRRVVSNDIARQIRAEKNSITLDRYRR